MEKEGKHMAKATIKRKAYIIDYNKETYKQFKFNVNRNTESDLIEYIETLPNKNQYIKDLIRRDMESKQ